MEHRCTQGGPDSKNQQEFQGPSTFPKKLPENTKSQRISFAFKTQKKKKNTQKLEPLEKWTKTQKKELAQRMFLRGLRSRAAGQVQAPIISRSITQKLYLYIYNKFKKKTIIICFFLGERTIIICWFGYSVFVIVLFFYYIKFNLFSSLQMELWWWVSSWWFSHGRTHSNGGFYSVKGKAV